MLRFIFIRNSRRYDFSFVLPLCHVTLFTGCSSLQSHVFSKGVICFIGLRSVKAAEPERKIGSPKLEVDMDFRCCRPLLRFLGDHANGQIRNKSECVIINDRVRGIFKIRR